LPDIKSITLPLQASFLGSPNVITKISSIINYNHVMISLTEKFIFAAKKCIGRLKFKIYFLGTVAKLEKLRAVSDGLWRL